MLTVRREQFRYMKKQVSYQILMSDIDVRNGNYPVLRPYLQQRILLRIQQMVLISAIPVILIQDQRIRRRQIRLLQSQHLRR